MTLPAKHFNKWLLVSATLAAPLLHSGRSQAQEIYYFSDRARDLEVAAESETLLSFPVPPFARVCQPAGIIELYPVESSGDLDSLLIPKGIQSSQNSSADLIARHLKLVPKRSEGTTSCAIRLTNEEVIHVRLSLSKAVTKPMIEFRSIMEKARSGAVLSQALGPINLFRALVAGGDLSFLAEDTPAAAHRIERSSSSSIQLLQRSTSIGSYQLVYVGTDKDLYKVWKFTGTAERDFSGSESLKDVKLGEFYFSTFRAGEQTALAQIGANPRPRFRKGDAFLFFALSRGDITTQEMLERLP